MILSKDTKLSVKAAGDAQFVELQDCQSISEFGGDNDKIEITTLADGCHVNMNGLDDYSGLKATFLFSNGPQSAFRKITTIGDHTTVDWKLEYPDGTSFTFKGQASIKINPVEVNQAITFDLTIAVTSEPVITNPA